MKRIIATGAGTDFYFVGFELILEEMNKSFFHHHHRRTDLFFIRWVCLFLCPKGGFDRGFQFAADSKPIYAQVLCSVVNSNLTIDEFKERMEQCMAIPYGFKKMPDGNVRMVVAEIEVVQRIYQRYVDGASLGGIATELEQGQVTTPFGNAKWSRSVIDKILSNGKYVPIAIPLDLFVAAQFEKESRTNIQTNNDGSPLRERAGRAAGKGNGAVASRRAG